MPATFSIENVIKSRAQFRNYRGKLIKQNAKSLELKA